MAPGVKAGKGRTVSDQRTKTESILEWGAAARVPVLFAAASGAVVAWVAWRGSALGALFGCVALVLGAAALLPSTPHRSAQVAVAVMALIAAAAVVQDAASFDSEESAGAAEASGTARSEDDSSSSTEPEDYRHAVHSLEPTEQDNPGQYGWGVDQPTMMNRPLVHGVDSKPLSIDRRELLGRQLERARAAALRLPTVRDAEAAGYKLIHEPKPGRGAEFVNDALLDSELELDHPEMLVYASPDPSAPVAGQAYYVIGAIDAGPPKDFPLEAIPWHYHYGICDMDGQYVASEDFPCEAEGGEVRDDLTGWMVDLWVVPGWENPWGLISSKHPDLIPPTSP